MVVPAVGVVVQDDYGGAAPVRPLLQEVKGVDQEMLLVSWVGVSGVTVLIALRLEEAHCGLSAVGDGGEEVVDVVLVVGGAIVSDFRDSVGARVRVIGGGSEVVEEGVMGNVILFRHAGDVGLGAARSEEHTSELQ